MRHHDLQQSSTDVIFQIFNVFFVLQLNWVCNQAWKSALVQSMFFIGSVAGTLLLGFLADLLGRIPVLIISNLLAVSGNLLTVYLIPNIWCLSVARFVAGLATDSNFFMMYIIGESIF